MIMHIGTINQNLHNVLYNEHSRGPMENIMGILHIINKGKITNTLESFHIANETKTDNKINDKHKDHT